MYTSLIVITFFLSFTVTFLSVLSIRSILRKKLISQPIYNLAPTIHKRKANTVTMGGLAIVLSVTLCTIVLSLYSYFCISFPISKKFIKFSVFSPIILLIIIVLLVSSLIGMFDDIKKVLAKKNNAGLTKRMKIVLQFSVSIFAIVGIDYIGRNTDIEYFKSLNLTNNIYISLNGYFRYLYYPFALFVLIGSSNAVNLTDGLDGLVSKNLIVTFCAFTIISILQNNIELLILNVIFVGALIAFLHFNIYPASIFMGDTGSISFGSVIALMSILLKIELLFILFSIIYIIEALSVIIQVIYFKYTKGKRIFKMAPLHHHFEKCNIHENQISFDFTIVNIMCTIIGLYIYWYFY